jgi:hypothetical protein
MNPPLSPVTVRDVLFDPLLHTAEWFRAQVLSQPATVLVLRCCGSALFPHLELSLFTPSELLRQFHDRDPAVPVTWCPNFLAPSSLNGAPLNGEGGRQCAAFRCDTMPLSQWCALQQQRSASGWAGDASSLYLKDWHWVAAAAPPRSSEGPTPLDLNPPAGRVPCYSPPALFQYDFLNAYSDYMASIGGVAIAETQPSSLPFAPPLHFGSGDDYRFLYIGEAGSWTPFHKDVFGSYSWSYNVGGEKLWFFAALDSTGGVPLDVRVSTLAYSAFVQEQGDLVFVPSNVYHQVANLSNAVSVNHNWCRETNIVTMAENLRQEVSQALGLMADDNPKSNPKSPWTVAEFADLIDLNLHTSGAWSRKSFGGFLRFLKAAIRHRWPDDHDAEEGRRLLGAVQAAEAILSVENET